MDRSFPTSQFRLSGYDMRARRNINKHGGGLIEFAKSGFIWQIRPNLWIQLTIRAANPCNVGLEVLKMQ